MSLLNEFRVVQIGPGLAAAACGRLLADVGAVVARIDPDRSTWMAEHLNEGTTLAPRDQVAALAAADLIVCEGSPGALRTSGHDADALRRVNLRAAVVLISPFGQSGPRAEEPATDLTLVFASGVARLLTGQVDDLNEAPLRPVGEQSAFLGGLAAACAGMHAALSERTEGIPGAVVDVSIHEALATLAVTELARAGQTGKSWPRQRIADGNGATVCILPARDGYAAISPREDRQWAAWLVAMGSPAWGNEARFARKADRIANWDALHALMSAWSGQHDKQWIADTAQAAHVPAFPLREAAEQLDGPQLLHRGFYRLGVVSGQPVKTPGPPFGIRLTPGDPQPEPHGTRPTPDGSRPIQSGTRPLPGVQAPPAAPAAALPLAGVRVLDFSWVIAGPTATRYLAAMGAQVIKVEAPGRGDPGRASELHAVLGQAKQAIVLDLKHPEAVQVAHALAARSDVLVENFATGVMDRLGLGTAALRAVNPGLIYVSASGLGRTGPEAHAVAYGTLLQCYAGFAGLNRHPRVPPRVGMAWLDPMCGLMLAFIVAAGRWRRRRPGGVARVDFSMIEAMLWTMAAPLLATQLSGPPQPQGNAADGCAPPGAWRCAGTDDWIAIAAPNEAAWRAICSLVPGLAGMRALGLDARQRAHHAISAALGTWVREQDAPEAAAALARAGVPAAAAATAVDLVESAHLRCREFWDPHGDGVLPGLPWRASFGRASGPAPGLGADTDAVLADVLGLSKADTAALRRSGALGVAG